MAKIRLAAAALGMLSMTMVMMMAGCAEEDDCDVALAKLVGECEMGGGASLSDTVTECRKTTKCAAECVNDHSCDEITSTQADGSYNTCRANCLNMP